MMGVLRLSRTRARSPAFARSLMNLRVAFSSLFALISALMLGMAAGAVWMVPTLYLQQAMPWAVLPIAWLLGKAIRSWVRPAGRRAALLAALATLTAALYVNLLTAAARIAGLMGMGLVDSMRTAGFHLLLQLAEIGQSRWDDLWYAVGMSVAAVVALRSRRQNKPGA
jgi:vitamin B12 transport system permease protein